MKFRVLAAVFISLSLGFFSEMTNANEHFQELVKEINQLQEQAQQATANDDIAEAIALTKHAFDLFENEQQGLAYLYSAANNLGSLYGSNGQWDRAKPLLEKSLVVRRNVYGRMDERTATAMMMLGVALFSLGENDEAISMLDECLEVREKMLGPYHPLVQAVVVSLANVYQLTGQLEKAAQYNARVEEIQAARGD